MDYVARARCGHIVGWISERIATDEPKDAAKQIGEWLRAGLSIERMTTEQARASEWCRCDEKPAATQRELALFGEVAV